MNIRERVKNRYWISEYILELLYRVARLEQDSSGGGSGEIPNLQQVLTEGSVATGGLNILLLDDDTNATSINPGYIQVIGTVSADPHPETNITPNFFSAQPGTNNDEITYYKFNEINFNNRPNASSSYSDVVYIRYNPIQDLIANKTVVFNLPNDKSQGDYTLATLDNITLQRAVNNNAYATAANGSVVGLLAGGPGYEQFEAYMTNGAPQETRLAGSIQVAQTEVGTQVSNGDPYGAGTMTRITQQSNSIEFLVQQGVNRTILRFDPPIYGDGANIKIPSLPTNRQYTLSVAEVFIDDATTTPLTSVQLGFYLNPKPGDKIYATAITGGPRIYEYIGGGPEGSTGWVEHSPVTYIVTSP